jgi:hypothetical protein
MIIPRLDLMNQLEKILEPTEDAQNLRIRIAHLWGSPGIGKTSLAKHYAELHQSDISFVFWVWTESFESVVTSYLQFAQNLVRHYSAKASKEDVENHLGLRGVDEMLQAKSILQLNIMTVKSVVQAVKDWLLRPKNDKWLLIFDHVQPTFDLFDFIPLTRSGRIMITSCDVEACSWGEKLPVGAMTEDEAMALLAHTLDRDLTTDSAEGNVSYFYRGYSSLPLHLHADL